MVDVNQFYFDCCQNHQFDQFGDYDFLLDLLLDYDGDLHYYLKDEYAQLMLDQLILGDHGY